MTEQVETEQVETEQVEMISRKDFYKKSFTDAATFFGGICVCTAAGIAFGPVGIGVAAGFLSVPILMSGVLGVHRFMVPQQSSDYNVFTKKTGLDVCRVVFKEAVADWKNAGSTALIMFAAGGLIGLTAYSLKSASDNTAARQTALSARPVLAPETVLKTIQVKAVDSCVNRNGDKLPAGYVVPVEHNGIKYKVICP